MHIRQQNWKLFISLRYFGMRQCKNIINDNLFMLFILNLYTYLWLFVRCCYINNFIDRWSSKFMPVFFVLKKIILETIVLIAGYPILTSSRIGQFWFTKIASIQTSFVIFWDVVPVLCVNIVIILNPNPIICDSETKLIVYDFWLN